MTNPNDSETKGPERIYVPMDDVDLTHSHECGTHFCIEYIRSDLYTQSQRELAEAQRELAEVRRERDEAIANEQAARAILSIPTLNARTVKENFDLKKERDRLSQDNEVLQARCERYRDCLSTLYARERPDSAVAQIIREALNPPTPNPSDAQASESDDAVTREGLHIPCDASIMETKRRLRQQSKEFRALLRGCFDPPEACRLEAHHTGEGWCLTAVDHDREIVCYLDWPKSWPESVNEDDLKQFGFEVV